MAKIILKYNAMLGKDHLPTIREISERLSLAVDGVTEEKPTSGKKLKVVSVSGSRKNLLELEKEIFRFPSITAKKIQVK